MEKNINDFWKSRKLKIALALAILLAGVFLRFSNLSGKIYWRDEVFTSLQISGRLLQVVEGRDSLFTGNLIEKSDIMNYQFSDSDTSYFSTVEGLKEFEPQLTPVYFLILRLWNNIFGDSVFVLRSFSVLSSILCIPLIYWLCLELFEDSLVGFTSAALVALSPFQILYAQEARPTSLWMLMTLVSCIALLKAQKKSTLLNWLFYSVFLSISLYTFLFSATTSIAHGLYVLISERFRLTKALLRFVFYSFLAWLTFIPWIVILINNPPSNYAAVPPQSVLDFPKGWLRNISLLFADFSINDENSIFIIIPFLLYLLVLVFLTIFFLLYIRNNAQRKASSFVLCLTFIPFLVLLSYDLGKGGQTTLRGSYLVPSLLGLYLCFGYGFASKLRHLKRHWIITLGLFLAISFSSSVFMVSSAAWWHKVDENIHHSLSQVIESSENPLVISDVEFSLPISLSHSLSDKVKYIFLPTAPLDHLWSLPEFSPGDFSEIFLYRPSEKLQLGIQRKYDVELTTLAQENNNNCNCPPEVLMKINLK